MNLLTELESPKNGKERENSDSYSTLTYFSGFHGFIYPNTDGSCMTVKPDPNWYRPSDPKLYTATTEQVTPTTTELTTTSPVGCPRLTGYWGGRFKNLKDTSLVFDAEFQVQIFYKDGRMFLTPQFFNETLAGSDTYKYHLLSGTTEKTCGIGSNCSVPVTPEDDRFVVHLHSSKSWTTMIYYKPFHGFDLAEGRCMGVKPDKNWYAPSAPKLYDGCICCGDYDVKLQCDRTTTTMMPTTTATLPCPMLTGYWGGTFNNLKNPGRAFDAEFQVQMFYKKGKMFLVPQFFNQTIAGSDTYVYHMLSGTADKTCNIAANCSIPVSVEDEKFVVHIHSSSSWTTMVYYKPFDGFGLSAGECSGVKPTKDWYAPSDPKLYTGCICCGEYDVKMQCETTTTTAKQTTTTSSPNGTCTNPQAMTVYYSGTFANKSKDWSFEAEFRFFLAIEDGKFVLTPKYWNNETAGSVKYDYHLGVSNQTKPLIVTNKFCDARVESPCTAPVYPNTKYLVIHIVRNPDNRNLNTYRWHSTLPWATVLYFTPWKGLTFKDADGDKCTNKIIDKPRSPNGDLDPMDPSLYTQCACCGLDPDLVCPVTTTTQLTTTTELTTSPMTSTKSTTQLTTSSTESTTLTSLESTLSSATELSTTSPLETSTLTSLKSTLSSATQQSTTSPLETTSLESTALSTSPLETTSLESTLSSATELSTTSLLESTTTVLSTTSPLEPTSILPTTSTELPITNPLEPTTTVLSTTSPLEPTSVLSTTSPLESTSILPTTSTEISITNPLEPTSILPTTSTELPIPTTSPLESTSMAPLTCPLLTGYWSGKFKNTKTAGRVFNAELQIQIAYKEGKMHLTQQFFNDTSAGTDSYRYHMLSGSAEESCKVGKDCSISVSAQDTRFVVHLHSSNSWTTLIYYKPFDGFGLMEGECMGVKTTPKWTDPSDPNLYDGCICCGDYGFKMQCEKSTTVQIRTTTPLESTTALLDFTTRPLESTTTKLPTTEAPLPSPGPESTLKDIQVTARPSTEEPITIPPTQTFADITTKQATTEESMTTKVQQPPPKPVQTTEVPIPPPIAISTESPQTTADDYELPPGNQEPTDAPEPSIPPPTTDIQVVVTRAPTTENLQTTEFAFKETSEPPDQPTLPFEATTELQFNVTQEIGQATTDISFNVTTEAPPALPPKGTTQIQWQQTTEKWEPTTGSDGKSLAINKDLTTGQPPLDQTTENDDLTTGWAQTTEKWEPTTGWEMTTENNDYPDLTTGVSARQTEPNDYPDLTTGVPLEMTTDSLVDDVNFHVKKTTRKVLTVTKEYTDCLHGFRLATDNIDTTSIQIKQKFGGFFIEDAGM
ncbi:hypothetical protein M3Y97_00953700 [Aphelenchoides bicaudatus]|nr:hypothetical protein M3Y97_00953700 [Aphelenchoides bicaudatus]